MLLSDGTSIQTHTAIGGGGLMASPLAASAGLPRGRGGRIEVRPDLTGEGFPGVYALGNFADIPGRFRFRVETMRDASTGMKALKARVSAVRQP